VAAYAEPQGEAMIWLRALVAGTRNSELRAEATSSRSESAALGYRVAETLRSMGADDALQRARSEPDR
jgi:porphobilinogen deaminase